MQASELGQSTLPSVEGGNHVLSKVEFLKHGAILERSQALELVVCSRKDAQSGMTRPLIVDLLQFVARDVEVVELGALESWPLVELVVGDVEPLQVGEGLLDCKAGDVLDLVVGQVQTRQSCQVFEGRNIGQSIVAEVASLHFFDLFSALAKVVKFLVRAHDIAELVAFAILRLRKGR